MGQVRQRARMQWFEVENGDKQGARRGPVTALLLQQGEVERVSEYRVEMICQENRIDAVLSALREAHPYEEPAFMVLQNLAFPAADTSTATRDARPR